MTSLILVAMTISLLAAIVGSLEVAFRAFVFLVRKADAAVRLLARVSEPLASQRTHRGADLRAAQRMRRRASPSRAPAPLCVRNDPWLRVNQGVRH
jgi:hypothetical protein